MWESASYRSFLVGSNSKLSIMMKRFVAILFCSVFIGNSLYAQVNQARYMPLYSTASGHYAFHTLINDKVMSQVMIESGIYAAVIDSAFFFKHKKELGMMALPNDRNKELNLGGKIYRITHRAKGKLPMGNMVYKGEVLILANYRNDTPITLPIQNLYHRSDWGSRIIMLDLDGGKLQMLTRSELGQWQGRRYKLNRNTYGRMPAVNGTVVFDTPKGKIVLEGNFNIDLGNPMPLYLREQSEAVKEFLEGNKEIQLTLGTSRSGQTLMTLIPQRCTMLGCTFERPVICITDRLLRFTTEGLIGLPLFKGRIAAFDFEKYYLYIQE